MTEARAKAIAMLDCFGVVGNTIMLALEAEGIVVSFATSAHEASIAANTVITAPMAPGADHILETYAAAEEKHYLGAAVSALETPYRKPKDKRVQQLLKDAEAASAAEQPYGTSPALRIFTDPRLKPGYKPPSKK